MYADRAATTGVRRVTASRGGRTVAVVVAGQPHRTVVRIRGRDRHVTVAAARGGR